MFLLLEACSIAFERRVLEADIVVDDLDRLLDEGSPQRAEMHSTFHQTNVYDCGGQSFVNRSITDKLLLQSGLVVSHWNR